MTPTSRFLVTVRPSSKLPASLRNNENIRQALAQVRARYPEGLTLEAFELQTLTEASRHLAKRVHPGKQVDVALQFGDLCALSSDIFRTVRAIRQDIKDILSEHEDELEENCVGALRYESEFRTEMAPALARSILLRNFANFMDSVLLAQIQFSSDDMEIELHIAQL